MFFRFFVFVFFLLISVSPKVLFAQNQCDWYTVDESATLESSIDDLNYDTKTFYLYKISNDAEKLYVEVWVSDYTLKLKIIRFGLTVWIDTEGKAKKKKGILFPLPQEKPDMPKQELQYLTEMERKQIEMQELKARNEYYDLIGFKGKKETVRINQNTENHPIKTGFFMSMNNMLVLKYEIPFEELGSAFALENDPVFTLGFESGYLKPIQKRNELTAPPQPGRTEQPEVDPNLDIAEFLRSSMLWVKKLKLAQGQGK